MFDGLASSHASPGSTRPLPQKGPEELELTTLDEEDEDDEEEDEDDEEDEDEDTEVPLTEVPLTDVVTEVPETEVEVTDVEESLVVVIEVVGAPPAPPFDVDPLSPLRGERPHPSTTRPARATAMKRMAPPYQSDPFDQRMPAAYLRTQEQRMASARGWGSRWMVEPLRRRK